MQVTEERKGAEITLKVEVPREKVKEEFSRAFQKLAKKTTVSGFRKGKIPRKIFEQRFGKKIIQEEAFKSIYSKVYKEAMAQKNINPITTPEVKILQFSEDQPLILKINLITKPEVELGNYKGIKVKKKKVRVTEEDIEQELKNLQKKYTQYYPVEDRVAKNGDWLYLNYQNLSEGKSSPKSKKNNFWYQLGSPNFPPSLQKELLGVKMGETKEIEVESPPKDPEKNIPNKKTNFNVKIKQVAEEKLLPLDDEFAKNLNFENLENLKDSVRKDLKKFKDQQEESRVKSEIVRKIVEKSKVEIPPPLIEKEMENRIDQLKKNFKNKDYTLSDYLEDQNLKEESLKKNVKLNSEQGLKTFFILDKIAEEEKIQVEEKEIDQVLKSLTQKEIGGEKLRHLKENLRREGRLRKITNQIKKAKITDFLYQQADISENLLSLIKK